jgi:hypothetical protein
MLTKAGIPRRAPRERSSARGSMILINHRGNLVDVCLSIDSGGSLPDTIQNQI